MLKEHPDLIRGAAYALVRSASSHRDYQALRATLGDHVARWWKEEACLEVMCIVLGHMVYADAKGTRLMVKIMVALLRTCEEQTYLFDQNLGLLDELERWGNDEVNVVPQAWKESTCQGTHFEKKLDALCKLPFNRGTAYCFLGILGRDMAKETKRWPPERELVALVRKHIPELLEVVDAF